MSDFNASDALVSARPIAGAPFGWEVEVDLCSALGPEVREALVRVWQRDGLILCRGQSLSMDQQLDACEIFGPVLRGALDNYLVSNVAKGGLLGNTELLFHNDIPFVPAPYLGGSLHALDVAETGAPPTRFVSAFSAWERLSEETRAKVEGLMALHVRGHLLGRRTTLGDLGPGDPCCVHPAVGRQQGSGRPYLFVNMDMTAQFTALSGAESDALLEELFACLYDPAHIYDHHWQAGDFVVWDNLAVQHARAAFGDAPRTLQRCSIATLGYWQQVPSDLATFEALQAM